MKTSEPSGGRQPRQEPDPQQVINEFLERYDLRECQTELWRLLSAAFSSEDADLWDKRERGNTVFFCRSLDQVLKALFEVKGSS
jgi:hypothetical protein